MTHVGIATKVPSGIVIPLSSMVFLHTLSRRGAVGKRRNDSLMTISRYSNFITASYVTEAWQNGESMNVFAIAFEIAAEFFLCSIPFF